MDQLYRRPPHSCGFCRRIILDHFELPQREARSGKNQKMYEAKTSIAYEKLSEGDESGCLLFRRILSAARLTNLKTGVMEARSDGALKLSLSFRINWRADEKYDGDLDAFQYRWEWEEGSSGDHLNACAIAGNHAARDILSRPLVKRRRDATFLWAKWLTQCDDEHQGCQVEADAMPSRLLFIGSDDSDDGAFRLVDCPTEGDKLRYAALSYCWGGDQGYKTMKANRNAYYRDSGIPKEALAPFKSVTDAIHVARRLGLSYLWIDSLCIVQDDAEDKGHEIGKMQDIYAGAYVTISAACAESSRDGFLDSMGDDDSQDFEMDYPCIDGTTGAVFLTKDQITSDRDDQPIDARAWTYQEYFLSPRVLVFERRKVRWLCFTEAHEDGGHDNDSGFKLLSSGKLARMSPAELDEEWTLAVERYSRRYLTVQSDKLPAMAGIAARFAPFLGRGRSSRYLAGVWESSLARQLAWDASWGNARSMRQPRRLAHEAPTWSWASIDGYIVFGGHEGGTEVRTLELEDYSRRLVSEDAPFGAVKSATLIVRARLQGATWKSGSIQPDANRRGYEAYEASFRDDVRDEVKRKEKLQCLETSTYLWTNAREETFLFSKGLIVVPSGENSFKRAGTFEVSSPVETPREGECHWNDRYWFVDSEPHVVALV